MKTVKELAEYLRLHEKTIRKWIKQGKIFYTGKKVEKRGREGKTFAKLYKVPKF